jgi:hypothetical protein
LEAARIILVNAVEAQPNVAIFHHNLACYECQLRNLEEAESRLTRAIELGQKALRMKHPAIESMANVCSCLAEGAVPNRHQFAMY